MKEYKILHVCADQGTESLVLEGLGTVLRITMDPKDTNRSHPVRGVIERLPLRDETQFDLGLYQPPCTKWAKMTGISGDPDDHPNLIPDAVESAKTHCEHYIIENVPESPLQADVVLNGRIFGLPIKYERAFKTSFYVEQPARLATLMPSTEVSPYFFSDRSREWWGGAKGYPANRYPKEHLAKNCIPRPYLEYLIRAWLRETNETDAESARSKH